MNVELAKKIEQAKVEYVNAINEISEKNKISYYFLSMILNPIVQEVNLLAQKELVNIKEGDADE